MRAGECRRAEQAAAEARALLIRPIDQLERDRRPSRAGDATHHLERCEHSETAVEPAAVRYRIDVAPDDQCLGPLALERCPHVSGLIDIHRDGQLGEQPSFPLSRPRPRVGPSDTLRPALGGSQVRECPQVAEHPLWLDGHQSLL